MADQDVWDLVDFLKASNVQVSEMATRIVEGLSGGQEGIDKLAPAATSLLPALLRLAPAESRASGPALTALVNLSQDMHFSEELVRQGTVARCMDWLREGRAQRHTDLVVKLLCNTTTIEQGSRDLLQLGQADLEGFNMAVLLSKFIQESAVEWDYVAAVLTNVTRQPEGRKLLLDPARGFLRALATQLRSDSLTRRRGCAASFRNCTFGAQKERDGTDQWLAEQLGVLRDVLDVLCGVTAEHESDDTVRQSLADAIYLMAQSDVTRQALVECGAMASLEKAYQQEEDPQVLSAFEGCFQSLPQLGSSAASSPGRWRPLPAADKPS